MKIILSPAKKMKVDVDTFDVSGYPMFLKETEDILKWLRTKKREELKQLWNANDKILEENLSRIKDMELKKNLTPAVLAYEGIAYQHMAPYVFTYDEIAYIKKNLRIISAFY